MVCVLHLAVVEQRHVVHVERALVEIEEQRSTFVCDSVSSRTPRGEHSLMHVEHLGKVLVEHLVHAVVVVAVVLDLELRQ